MWEDPVVKEVRQAAAQMAKKAKNDIHVFFENLRKAEADYQGKIVREVPRPRSASARARGCP